MNKYVRWVQNYLLYALPFVLICMAWGTLDSEKTILSGAGFLTKATWEVISWNLILWFAVLIAFLILLVAIPEVRDKTLKRLANLNERDEREQFITGKASRAAYISMLSLLICLLFFSIFSLSIHRVPEKDAVNGKRGTLAIGLEFSLLDKPPVAANPEVQVLFASKSIPLSKPAILLALIIWQLAVFNITARRENLRELEG